MDVFFIVIHISTERILYFIIHCISSCFRDKQGNVDLTWFIKYTNHHIYIGYCSQTVNWTWTLAISQGNHRKLPTLLSYAVCINSLYLSLQKNKKQSWKSHLKFYPDLMDRTPTRNLQVLLYDSATIFLNSVIQFASRDSKTRSRAGKVMDSR